MNIDVKKFKEAIDRGDRSHRSIISILKGCEIKPVNCDECDEPKEFNNPMTDCAYCINNPHFEDNFKPKQNELDKLFIGAPVIYEHQNGFKETGIWGESVYDDVKETIRLPTINEAPRNAWLAPWLGMPEMAGFYIIIRFNEGEIIHDPSIKTCKDRWDEVEAVMILEDFKK